LWKQVETDGSDTHYLYGGDHIDNLAAKHTEADGTIWYLKDRLNTVRGLVDHDGNLINETEYSAYGEILENSDPAKADSFAFTGREFDQETGLYYYRARYYDPETARFISRDPIETDSGDFNFYRYVENQPGFYVDPSGLNSSEHQSIVSRLSVAENKIAQCLADITFGQITTGTLYLLILNVDVGKPDIYVGETTREFQVRLREHTNPKAKRSKRVVGFFQLSFPIPEGKKGREFIKVFEQMLIDDFGGTASLDNVDQANKSLQGAKFSAICEAAQLLVP